MPRKRNPYGRKAKGGSYTRTYYARINRSHIFGPRSYTEAFIVIGAGRNANIFARRDNHRGRKGHWQFFKASASEVDKHVREWRAKQVPAGAMPKQVRDEVAYHLRQWKEKQGPFRLHTRPRYKQKALLGMWPHKRRKNPSKRKKPPIVDIEDTGIDSWFERDRAYVGLENLRTGDTILEFWDDDVLSLIEDGFIDPSDYHESMYNYAVHLGVIRER